MGKNFLLLISLFITLGGLTFVMGQNQPTPPVATKIPKTDKLHGETRVDNYYWLRDKNNPEVISYLEAENTYADTILKPYEGFQEKLYKEIVGRIKQTDLSVPYKEGKYLYYTRTEEGKQYIVLCRKQTAEAEEEILLDLNELAQGQKFMSLGTIAVSPDGTKLAYSTDNNGFRQYVLFVKDLETKKTFPQTRERVTSLQWAADNKTLFYTIEDAQTKRSYQLYRHVLGSDKDDLVYEEKDPLYTLRVSKSDSKAYIFITSTSSTTSECRFLPADQPNQTPKLLLEREEGHQYYLEHHGDFFYIRTNQDAKNFRLIKTPIASPTKENWKEVVPHKDNVTIENISFFINHYILFEREDGLQKMIVTDLRSNKSHSIEFPDPVYAAFSSTNREFNTNIFRFSYQSYVIPNSIFDYNLDTQQRQLLKQDEVVGGYDANQYKSERIFATATDGTKIPISLVYKKDLIKDGSRPMYLTGYGAYGISIPTTFSSSLLSLLNRGVIFARAHVRGGGDLGKTWHDQGKMMLKRNTFTDFINAAEYLISEKYTSNKHLVIQGGSAGGLLMGAVLNMRPELFKAAIVEVPFVDVINTMLDESLPLTTGEFLEWGNPKVKNEYDYIKSYCPYSNIAAKAYPNILVKTSLNDSQVMYWEPAKYVAKLRANKTDNNLLLLKTNLAGGHGGSSGRYDRFKEVAFNFAFVLEQVGIIE